MQAKFILQMLESEKEFVDPDKFEEVKIHLQTYGNVV